MARKLSRQAVAAYVADRLIAGDDQAHLMQQVAAYLIESGRTSEVSLTLRDIQYYLSEKQHLTGTVVSARELSQASRDALHTYLAAETGAAHISIAESIDPTLIGGIRLSLPGKELDTSLSRKITVLKTRYKKA